MPYVQIVLTCLPVTLWHKYSTQIVFLYLGVSTEHGVALVEPIYVLVLPSLHLPSSYPNVMAPKPDSGGVSCASVVFLPYLGLATKHGDANSLRSSSSTLV